MSLIVAKIYTFLESPFPLWEEDLTLSLVNRQWDDYEKFRIWPENYSTARGLHWDSNIPDSNKVPINDENKLVRWEYPQEILNDFYTETGLEPLSFQNPDSLQIAAKLRGAISALASVTDAYQCVELLVRTIQVLKQQDEEIDSSYSHPEIPFSIFISLCSDNSEISNLRVAESILHEAMHLKLTLIEKHVELIVPGTEETFYSPWRDEQRPVRGVLHGLFVFSAIKEFYKIYIPYTIAASDFINNRNYFINSEINKIKQFHLSNGLTTAGQKLARDLIQFQIQANNHLKD